MEADGKPAGNPCLAERRNSLFAYFEHCIRLSHEKLFTSIYSLKFNFYKTRKSLAFKLQNPRLKEISLHTFRHWKATIEYHKTRDILHVQQVLGHKDLRNTLIYINIEKALFQSEDDGYHMKVAHSIEEACKLLEVGFEYVTEIDGARIFKKRK